MKKVLLISLLVVSLLSARQVFVDTNDALSVKVSNNITNIDNENINENSVRSSREEIVLFEWDWCPYSSQSTALAAAILICDPPS